MPAVFETPCLLGKRFSILALHRRIVAAYRLRKARLCRLVALGDFGFAKIIINCFCLPTRCDRTQISYKNRKTPTEKLVFFGAGRGVFVSDEDTHTLRLKSELFDLRVGYANPILQHFVAEVGSRPLVLRDKNKHHPRGMVFVFMAQAEGFEPPCLLGKRFSRRNTLSDFRRN